MSVGKGLLSGGVVLLLSVVVCAAPGDNNSGEKTPTASRRSRAGLTKPWNELKDLTDDEKTKIVEIHRKAVDQVHEIEAKEHADIVALLSDQQKKEVAEIEAKDRQATRERRRPATQPSASARPSDTSEK
jgi:Spy/CpxP family protein refolding chaperone